MNPDLLPAGTDPQAPPAVPSIAAITRPLPATKSFSTKYYVCTVSAASMHRKDGKKLPFVFGFLATDLLHDQEYLDAEIVEGNTYVREATEEEIRAANMKFDPKGTIKKELAAELEPQIRAELEQKLRGEMEDELRKQVAALQDDKFLIKPPESEKIATDDAGKLGGIDALKKRIEDAKKSTVEVPGAKVIMTSQAAPITPVSTAAVADAAAESGK